MPKRTGLNCFCSGSLGHRAGAGESVRFTALWTDRELGAETVGEVLA